MCEDASCVGRKRITSPPMSLEPHQIVQYEREGWLAPIRVMSEARAEDLHGQLCRAERERPEDLHATHRNNPHLVVPFLADLARDPAIVTPVQQLLGPDLTLWSTVLFAKEPDSSAFVSWHQDARYMALEPADFVTAWVALTPSTVESGCVSVIPRSHRERRDHVDTYADDNILTRGQRVDGIDDASAVHLELRPGEMSLHHPWLVHGSQPNRSAGRRVGVAMQSYLGAGVRPTLGEHHVMHISGRPVHPSFVEAPSPTVAFGPAARAARAAANAAFADVLYAGAEQRRAL